MPFRVTEPFFAIYWSYISLKSFNLKGVELTTSLNDVLERFDAEDMRSDFVEFYKDTLNNHSKIIKIDFRSHI